jgi:hypothetical protein
MPTVQKPSLQHRPLDWDECFSSVERGLRRSRTAILKTIGFTAEYNPQTAFHFPHHSVQAEGDMIMDELVGILVWAAKSRVDGGFKPASQIIATLKALRRNKALLHRRDRIEAEALGALELAFEARFRKILAEMPAAHELDLAIDDAIASLKSQTRRRGPNIGAEKLAVDLQSMFGRFGTKVGRIVDRTNAESGEFVEFLNLVIPPLNNVLRQHHAVPLNIRSIATRAAAVSKGKLRA